MQLYTPQDCMSFAPNSLVVDPALQNAQTPREAWASHSGRDLAALSLCNVIILSSGSFGLFAALLQRKHVRDGVVFAYRHGEHVGSANALVTFVCVVLCTLRKQISRSICNSVSSDHSAPERVAKVPASLR
jgi:hypothetical protein